MIAETLSLLTTAGGGIFGAIQAHVRLLSIQKHELAMLREKLDQKDQENARDHQGWFTNLLRLLFLLYFATLICVLLILPPLLHQPLFVENQTHPGWFLRLFGVTDKLTFLSINGFYFSPVVCMFVGYIATFLFGGARVKR